MNTVTDKKRMPLRTRSEKKNRIGTIPDEQTN